MLPDFPEQKSQLHKLLTQRFKNKLRAEMGIWDEVKKIAVHEGDRVIFTREDDSEHEISFVEMCAKFTISDDELEGLTPHDLAAKVDEAAKDMARQQHDHIFASFTEAVKRVGNDLDARGEPLRPEHILSCLELIHVDFDREGRPRWPTIIIHPDMAPQFRRVFEMLERDPVLRRRLAEVIAQKREEWRARESRRKLAG